MLTYSLNSIEEQLTLFDSFKEDYLYNFSLFLNKPLIGPHMLQLVLTTKCNLKCKMCGVWKVCEEELETYQIKRLIDDTYKLGNLKIVYFTGGEVLLRPDIFELLSYVNERYPDVLTDLNTNGLLLTKENINKLFEAKLRALSISIDSPLPDVHNFLRGKGVFEKVTGAINCINTEKKRRKTIYPLLSSCSVLMEQTLNSMYDMLGFCIRHNMGAINIQPYVCNTDLRGEKDDEFWIQKERLPDLQKVLEKIKSKKGKLPLRIGLPADKIYKYFSEPLYNDKCYAGFTRALAVGRKICFVCNGSNLESKQHFGLADKDSIIKAWFSKEASSFRKTIKSCKKNCVQFCAIRPSADSLSDIHSRLVGKNKLHFLFKERYFLKAILKLRKILVLVNYFSLKVFNLIFKKTGSLNLFLLCRETHFLIEYYKTYPQLPVRNLLEDNFDLLGKNLKKFFKLISRLKIESYSRQIIREYLLKDLRLVNDCLVRRSENKYHLCEAGFEINSRDIGFFNEDAEIDFYKKEFEKYNGKLRRSKRLS